MKTSSESRHTSSKRCAPQLTSTRIIDTASLIIQLINVDLVRSMLSRWNALNGPTPATPRKQFYFPRDLLKVRHNSTWPHVICPPNYYTKPTHHAQRCTPAPLISNIELCHMTKRTFPSLQISIPLQLNTTRDRDHPMLALCK